MATLASIVRKQRMEGKGALESLISGISERTKERMDPRRIFDQRGLITALFPSLKPFQARGSESGIKMPDSSKQLQSTSPTSVEMNIRLIAIEKSTKITATNTMSLPGLARDMNVARQNLQQLVKLQGGTAKSKADAFFLKASERERATEAQLEQKTVEKVGDMKKEEKDTGMGLLSSLSGIFTLKKFLLFGAAVVGITAVLLTFRDEILSAINAISNFVNRLGQSIRNFMEKYLKESFEGPPSEFERSFPGATQTLGFSDPSAPIPDGPVADFFQEQAVKARRERDEKEAADYARKMREEREAYEAGQKASNHAEKLRQTSPTPAPVTPETTSKTSPTQDVSIGSAIVSAAAETGIPAETLAIFGQVESSLGKFVENELSSAKGAFQFIDRTWLSILQKHGKKYGYDPSTMTRQEQLDLRFNNKASALMAAELIKENAKILGIDPTNPSNVDKLYLAHFLGPGRAKQILSGEELSEKQKASIMKYNPNIKSGSVEEFLQFASSKTTAAARTLGVKQITALASTSGTQVASASTAVEDARMAAMTPAALLPAMLGLATPKTPGLQTQQVAIPTTTDSDLFDALVMRVTEFA